MANYSLIVGSKFSPFTYQELLQPALLATQAHQELESQYADLATKANVWEGLANEQTDPEAYSMYKKYSDDLQKQADLLAREGLNINSRKALANMKSRYSSEIVPIEQAYKTRQNQAEQQQQALLKDPTLMFSRRAATTSLSDYMRNPQLSYEIVSGADLSNRVAAQASSLASSLQAYGEGRPIDAYTNTFIKKYGFTKEQIQKAINNPSEGDPVLNAIVENTIASTGMGQLNEIGELIGNGWADKDTLNKAYSYARQGLSKAVGKQEVQMFDDFAAKKNLEYENAKRIADYKAYLDSLKDNKDNIVQPRISLGAQGSTNETVERLRGLKLSDDGVSTIYKDRLLLEQHNAKKELESFIKNSKNIEEIKSYKPNYQPGKWGYEELAKALSKTTSNPPPEGYHEYMRLQNKLSKATEALEKENEYIDSIYNKYKHLGTNKQEALNRALSLIDTQEKEASFMYPLNLNETDYKKVLSGIKRQLNLKEGTEVLTEADSGKSIKVGDKKYKDIFDNILDKGSITISSGNNPRLLLNVDGKSYSFKNYQNITNLDTYLKKSNDFLKDFSDTGIDTSKAIPISDSDYNTYIREGAGSVGLNPKMINKNTIIDLGDGYKGLILHVDKTGKYIKVFLDSQGNVLASNSVEEEVDYGGINRDRNIMKASEAALNKLVELFANEQ